MASSYEKKAELIARIAAMTAVAGASDVAWVSEELFSKPIASRAEQLTYAFVMPDKDSPESVCVACGREIRWAVTESGKRLPVNPSGVPHWFDCEESDKWLT